MAGSWVQIFRLQRAGLGIVTRVSQFAVHNFIVKYNSDVSADYCTNITPACTDLMLQLAVSSSVQSMLSLAQWCSYRLS